MKLIKKIIKILFWNNRNPLKRKIDAFTSQSDDLMKRTAFLAAQMTSIKNRQDSVVAQSETITLQVNSLAQRIDSLLSRVDVLNQQRHNGFVEINKLQYDISELVSTIHENAMAIAVSQNYDRTKKRNRVVYTCITGDYEGIPFHEYVDDRYDYVCFTDSKKLLKFPYCGVWKICPLAFSKLDNTKNNRWHKTHPHILFPDYEMSIYLDGNIIVKSPWLFNQIDSAVATGRKILIPLHYLRTDIYDDMEFCVNILKKETFENEEKMKSYLLEHGMPRNYGLNENNMIFRQHNDLFVIQLMDEWWYFIENFSKRDQFSFSYVLFAHGIRPQDIAIRNLRGLYNDFRFINHDSVSEYADATVLPDYINNGEYTGGGTLHWSLERYFWNRSQISMCGYAVDGDDDIEVIFKACHFFYKCRKVLRDDIKQKFNVSKPDVGFDIRIYFGEGNPFIYFVNHTKKTICYEEITHIAQGR